MMIRKILLLLVTGLWWIVWPCSAYEGGTDTLIYTRLYRGERKADVLPAPIVSSREIDAVFQADEAYHAGQEEEAAKIRRIYNLSGVNLVNQGGWQWREGMPKRLIKVFRFREGAMAIRMVHESQNRFTLRIASGQDIQDQGRELLDSAFDMGENRTTVFGFSDEQGVPWFLSFHRSTVIRSSDSGSDAQADRRVIPTYYPQEALQSGIEGNVVLAAELDDKGGIRENSLRVVEGNLLLQETAVSAFQEMGHLGVPKVQERPKAVVFLFMFRLQGEDGEKISHSDEIEKYRQSPGYLQLERELKEADLKPWVMKAVLIIARCKSTPG